MILILAALIVTAAPSATRPSARVSRAIWAFLQNADQNAYPILNVHPMRPASTTSVRTLVLGSAGRTLYARLSVITLFAAVLPVTLAIRSLDVVLRPVSVRGPF